MESYQIGYFLAVAELLNFTQAAAKLHITQPSLSRAIQKLEVEFAGPLFRRERSHTHLTPLGRAMLPHLTAAFAAAEAAQREARDRHRNPDGHLSLGACDATRPHLIGELFQLASQEHRTVGLKIEVAPVDSVRSELLNGRHDAAVVTVTTPSPRPAERLDFHFIAHDRLVVAFPTGHRFAAKQDLPLEELDGEPLAEPTTGRHVHCLVAAMAARGLNRVVRHVTNNDNWIAQLVGAGLACAVLPQSTAKAAGLDHRILSGLPFARVAVLATVAGRRHSPLLAELVGRLKASRPPDPSASALKWADLH